MGKVPDPRICCERERDPADLPDRAVAAGQKYRADRAGTLKVFVITDKKFSALYRSVNSQTGAVPDDPEARPAQIIIRHAGSHVRPVVLDLEKRNVI